MKRFICAVLAVAMAVTAFTGCVPGSENNPGQQNEKSWNQNPLTGEEQSVDYPYGNRPVAVMVNNMMDDTSYQISWPQKGLSDADVVFEMETEGGITRYMALFRDWTKIPVVGPIRSARDQFVQMMIPYGSLYVHDGASTYAKDMLANYSYSQKDLTPNLGIAFRDESLIGQRAYEHTEFTSGELITDAIQSGKYEINTQEEPMNLFHWVKYDEPARVLDGVDVSEVEWRFSNSYAAKIKYDPQTNKYTKEHINLYRNFSRPLIDANYGERPVEFDNVLVLWTQIDKYPDGVLSDVSLEWGGVGYYFNGGKVEKVRWLKGMPHEPLRIVSLDGTETDVEINVGKSYIAVVDLDYFGAFKMDGEVVDVAGDYTSAEEMPVEPGVEANE